MLLSELIAELGQHYLINGDAPVYRQSPLVGQVINSIKFEDGTYVIGHTATTIGDLIKLQMSQVQV